MYQNNKSGYAFPYHTQHKYSYMPYTCRNEQIPGPFYIKLFPHWPFYP